MKTTQEKIDEHSHKLRLGVYIDYNKAWRYQEVTIIHEHDIGHHKHKHEHLSACEL